MQDGQMNGQQTDNHTNTTDYTDPYAGSSIMDKKKVSTDTCEHRQVWSTSEKCPLKVIESTNEFKTDQVSFYRNVFQ